MIWINFGKWCRKVGPLYEYKRIYIKGYRWTPIVRSKLRSFWRVHKEYPDGSEKEEIKEPYSNGVDQLGDIGCP